MDNKLQIEKILELTPMQEGMLFHSLKDKDSGMYIEQLILSIDGDIDINLFEKSCNYLIERHELLRTVFIYKKIKNPRQIVLKERHIKIKYEDLCHLIENEGKEYIQSFIQADRKNAFDLSKDLLNRIAIFRTSRQSYTVIWSFHHIIMDGWCLGIILKELFQVYESFLSGHPLDLPKTRSFSDFIQWRKMQDYEKASSYWREYLDGFEQATVIPASFRTQQKSGFPQEVVQFSIDENTTSSLRSIAKTNKVSLNNVVQAIWGVILARYNNTSDVAYGTVVSGRTPDLPGIENTVGLFINTIPFRIKFSEDDTFSELLKNVQLSAYTSDSCSYMPLTGIYAVSPLKDGTFDHIMAFENYPISKEVNKLISGRGEYGIAIKHIEVQDQTNYDFNIAVMPGDVLEFKISYNPSVYSSTFIQNTKGHIFEVIRSIIKDADTRIADINILTREEKKQILVDFNDTATDYGEDKLIHELFEEQAERIPDNPAVIHGDKVITYKELNTRANILANMLREKGVKADTIVGIMAGRNSETIIGILGILKAGGAYLPLDPKCPLQRLEYILGNSNTKIVLSQNSLPSEICFDGDVLAIDKVNMADEPENYMDDIAKASENLRYINNSRNLAYIIYTSGSTGKPKGSMIEHRSVVRLVRNTNYLEFKPDDRILQVTSPMFDISTFEIWGALLNGLRLYITDEDTILNPQKLFRLINEYGITIMAVASPLFNQLSRQKPDMFAGLRNLFVGGDVLSPKDINNTMRYCPSVRVINGYGPTENTALSTCMTIDKEYEDNIPIGGPISNSTAYILDKNKRLLPIGIHGELCVGGHGVARGYLNNPNLTKAKFIDNPFVPGDMLYKTGDLARWLPDGNIEFLGRMDSQVKIRGFRIELEEIKKYIVEHELIDDVLVTVKTNKNGDKHIYAYYIASRDIPASNLTEHLKKSLPDYMIPSFFIRIEKIPLTINGKVDMGSLPDVQVEEACESKIFESPEDEIEGMLAKLWEDILEIKNVSVNDDFFELGGDSLSIIRVIAVISDNKWNLNIQDFYEHRTIRRLAKKIKGIAQSEAVAEASAAKEYEINPVAVAKGNGTNAMSNALKNNTNNEERSNVLGKGVYEPKGILLTGSTGFLGSHLLERLLANTKAMIYCLVRGSNIESAQNRLKELMGHYFSNFDERYYNRIEVVNGDISKEMFGLSKDIYDELHKKIDIVINAAALVKHFGNYEDFKKVNVLGTEEVVRFALYNSKKLCHISTTSVSGDYTSQCMGTRVFAENDFYIGQNFTGNVYVRSKFEAENIVFKAMDSGLEAAIFRVGNLTGGYGDGHFQLNIEDNRFYNILKFIITLGIVPESIIEQELEFTPVDICSEAFLKLLSSGSAMGKVFHLFNHNYVRMHDVIDIMQNLGCNIEIMESENFKEKLKEVSKDKSKHQILKGIIPYISLENGLSSKPSVKIDSKMTVGYLEQLGLKWPVIDEEYIKRIFNHMKEVGFIKGNDKWLD